MKKFAKFFAVALVAVMALSVLVACDTTKEPTKLATPVVTVDENGVASWKAIDNAKAYAYKIDGGKETVINKTSVTLTNGQSITVKAVGNGTDYIDSDYSAAATYKAADPKPTTGLPTPAAGFYMTNADLVQENDTTRYLVYTTNETAADNYNRIAIRKGVKTDDGYVYGEESVAVEGGDDNAWDTYIGSASIVKGTFAKGEETYNWLIAYCATNDAEDRAFQIGIAVAKDPMGTWTKLDAPVITFDKNTYGATSMGCYAPSVVNYNKESGIRIFYTYADTYGHFAYLWDANLADLTKIDGQKAMLPTNGNLSGGDAELMFPNADFAYDETNKKFVAVKDYSPSAGTKPNYADRFELAEIAEKELYTIEIGKGWTSLQLWDTFDLDNGYERAYSACIVSDAYGHLLAGDIELVYNVCDTAEANADYLYSQKLMTVTYTAE